jgi:hypothetical protein
VRPEAARRGMERLAAAIEAAGRRGTRRQRPPALQRSPRETPRHLAEPSA